MVKCNAVEMGFKRRTIFWDRLKPEIKNSNVILSTGFNGVAAAAQMQKHAPDMVLFQHSIMNINLNGLHKHICFLIKSLSNSFNNHALQHLPVSNKREYTWPFTSIIRHRYTHIIQMLSIFLSFFQVSTVNIKYSVGKFEFDQFST